MAKKPSEWTPQEAWNEAQKAMIEAAVEFHGKAVAWLCIPFPADPREAVSDDYLRFILGGRSGAICQENAIDLARELLARREAERKA